MSIEALLGRFLRLGVLGASGFIATGLVLMLLQSTESGALDPWATPNTLQAVLTGVIHGDPTALISLGLILLTLTPVTRVAAAAVAFAWERDYPLAAASFLVLVILSIGLALGATE